MRKLIIAVFIFAIVLIGWIGYLKYDTERFIDSLPEFSTPEQQSGEIAESDSLRDVNEATTTNTITDVKNEYGTAAEQAHIVQSDDRLVSTGSTNAEEGLAAHTLEDNSAKLTHEIKTLFVRYKELFDQSREVNRELEPFTNQRNELILHLQKDLPYNDLIETIKQIEELDTYIMPLQDETERLDELEATLFIEYGFATEDEFYDKYGEIFDVWKAEH